MTTSRQTWGAPVHEYMGRARTEARSQVHATAVAERCHMLTGARVERDQVLAADDEQPSFGPVGPVGHAARAVAAQPLPRLVGEGRLDPQRFAGAGMKGLDQPDAVRAVQHAVDHQRRRAEVVGVREVGDFRADAGVDRRPPPRDAELRDVRLVDLIERGVLGASSIAAVACPFTLAGPLFRGAEGGGRQDHAESQQNRCAHVHGDLSPLARAQRIDGACAKMDTGAAYGRGMSRSRSGCG